MTIIKSTHRVIACGHRTYLDNPKLVVTLSRKPPLPHGHRKWLEIADKREPVDIPESRLRRIWR